MQQTCVCLCSPQKLTAGDNDNDAAKKRNLVAYDVQHDYSALAVRGVETLFAARTLSLDHSGGGGSFQFMFSSDCDKPNKITATSLKLHHGSIKLEPLSKGWFVPGVVLRLCYNRSLNVLVAAITNHFWCWDLYSGELLAKVRAHNFDISHMQFIESSFGAPILITCSNDLMLKYWSMRHVLSSAFTTNVPTTKPEIAVKLTSRLVALAMSCIPDICTVTGDGLCRLYDANGSVRSSYVSACNSQPTAVCVSSTGMHVFLGFNSGRVEQLLTCRQEADNILQNNNTSASNNTGGGRNLPVVRVLGGGGSDGAVEKGSNGHGSVACIECDALCQHVAVGQQRRVTIYDIYAGQVLKSLTNLVSDIELIMFCPFTPPDEDNIDANENDLKMKKDKKISTKQEQQAPPMKRIKATTMNVQKVYLPATLERKLSQFENFYCALKPG